MQTTVSDSMKREAANRVLQRLGEEMIEVIKYHLRRSFAISFDPKDNSPLSLEQLHFGLSVMLGEGTANNVLKQITDELKEMSYANDAQA